MEIMFKRLVFTVAIVLLAVCVFVGDVKQDNTEQIGKSLRQLFPISNGVLSNNKVDSSKDAVTIISTPTIGEHIADLGKRISDSLKENADLIRITILITVIVYAIWFVFLGYF